MSSPLLDAYKQGTKEYQIASDNYEYGYQQGRADVIKPILDGIEDFRTLEMKMTEYFCRVDISKEKTELERLALDIVCIGMQTMGCLIYELDKLKGQNNA